MSLRIKSMAVRILNAHGLKLGAQDKPRTRLNPLVTALFVHFWCLVMYSVHQREWVEDFLWKRITTRYQIQARKKAYGIHIDTKRMNVGDNVSVWMKKQGKHHSWSLFSQTEGLTANTLSLCLPPPLLLSAFPTIPHSTSTSSQLRGFIQLLHL